MTNQCILFTAPCVAELCDLEVQQPGPKDVLVRLAYSTISSGTERANLVGDLNISYREKAAPVAQFPRRSGYSSAGVVEKVGCEVTSVQPGDRVALSWSQHNQYVCLAENNVYKLENSAISFQEAALWHISTFPMAAIRKCRLEIGESAIVMGMGILGLMALKLLRAAGAAPVIAADPNPAKRELALSHGADYALDPMAPDFADTVRSLTKGGTNVAIEVTGVGQALDGVLDCMAQFGRVALLGCTRHSDFTIDYYRKVHGPGISLIGAHTMARPNVESSAGLWITRDDIKATERLTLYRGLDLLSLVQEVHSPAEAPEVYTRLANEKAFPVVQFDWSLLNKD